MKKKQESTIHLEQSSLIVFKSNLDLQNLLPKKHTDILRTSDLKRIKEMSIWMEHF